jgi:hypothetical protein
VKGLIELIKTKASKSTTDPATKELVNKLLSESNTGDEVGFLFKEKIVNIPGVLTAPALFQLKCVKNQN